MDATITTFGKTERTISLASMPLDRTGALHLHGRTATASNRRSLMLRNSPLENAVWILLGTISLATILLSLFR
jgi:hypothetical protein